MPNTHAIAMGVLMSKASAGLGIIWKVQPADFALLRTPLKHVGFMPTFDPNCGDVNQLLRSRLVKLAECLRDPVALAAITHASASLGTRASTLRPEDVGKENIKLAIALYKYVTRLSRRCTPFGLMAALSTLEVGEKTSIQTEPNIRLHARLSNDYTARIARSVRERLLRTRNNFFRIFVNNTAYSTSTELRHVTRIGLDSIHYRFGAVRRTSEIDSALSEVGSGIQSGPLVTRLCERLGCSEDEAWAFVEDLIAHEVLYTEIEIALTSGDCFGALVQTARAVEDRKNENEDIHSLLKQIHDITCVDGTLGYRIRQISDHISQLIGEDPARITNPIHLDAYREPNKSTLGRGELQELTQDLASLLGVMWRPHEALQTFTRTFEERFGDREVPLLEALDADTGIAFGPPRIVPSPLLGGIISASLSPKSTLEWSAWQQFLLERIINAIARGETEILFDRGELTPYTRPPGRHYMSLSLGVHVSLLDARGATGASTFLLRGIFGSSAANLLGRFTCGDANLATKVRQLADQEQANTYGRLAEIVHVPASGKATNVLARTRIRDAEIVYGPVISNGPQPISCADLLISIHEGKLRLRSRVSGEEILPRLASAHFTGAKNLPVYQFLAAMQYIDGHCGSFLDSKLFDQLPHIPRIRVGSILVSSARWRLTSKESEVLSSAATVEDLMKSAQALRASRGMPRWVALAEGDNLLDIDLEDPLSVLTLGFELKGWPALLIESLFAAEQSEASIGGMAAANEIIIPMYVSTGELDKNQRVTAHEMTATENTGVARERPLQRWVYLEIFTGESSAEQILIDAVGPYMEALQVKGRISKWFFVRYYESDKFHLRLRMLPIVESDRLHLADDVMSLFAPWIKDGIVYNMRVCGYEPEIDRYGGLGSIPICEDVFHLHSEVIVKILKAIITLPDREDKRWIACAALVWETLNIAYSDAAEIVDFATTAAQAYWREMPSSPETNKAVSLNYRAHRGALEGALTGQTDDRILEPIFDQRVRTRRQAALQDLATLHEASRLRGIIASLIHMDCNRIFPFKPRASEMIIYEYLGRYARSRLARAQDASVATAAI